MILPCHHFQRKYLEIVSWKNMQDGMKLYKDKVLLVEGLRENKRRSNFNSSSKWQTTMVQNHCSTICHLTGQSRVLTPILIQIYKTCKTTTVMLLQRFI